uniref:ornithine decarboxylase n=1 Tax=Salarias fasciatus TaxID=181472 RepID=A0A672HZK3_SALFA
MMPGSLPVNQNIEILENGKTIRDIIDSKIKELDSAENQQPFFVANLDCVLKAHLRWTKNLPRVKPFYAVKCNDKPTVVSMLSALGTGFDCASKGEIQLALSLGVTPDKIIYANPTKPSYHIKYAASQGVDTMTFDNEEELLKISSLHAQAKLVLRIAVDHSKSLKKLNLKFGATLSSAGKLLERAAQLGLQVIGVSFHVGCLCTDSLTFKRAIADSRHVFDMAKSLGFKMSLLDIGGGFTGTDLINESLDEFFPSESGVRIIAEPGRYFVESAFTLAVNVIAKKTVMNETEENCDNTESGPDRTMEYYINDGVFGSISSVLNFPDVKIEPYLHRVKSDAVGSSELKYKSVIWGPTCDCIDKVLENYWIPELRVGDWLLMDNAGAYTLSICSDFNNFERALIYFSASADTYNRFMRSHNQFYAHNVKDDDALKNNAKYNYHISGLFSKL